MCFLAAYPAGVTPNGSHLWEAAATNRDGSGWAIVSGRKIIKGKSMDPEQAVEDFIAARKRHSGEALFHHRYGTHGTMNLSNVHPFNVGSSRKTVLAHNGILPALAQPKKGDVRSDTRKFSQDLLPTLWGHKGRVDWDDAATLGDIEKWIGGYNKLVILTADPAYAHALYIANAGSGAWVAGDGTPGDDWGTAWYSNSDWRPYVPPVRPVGWFPSVVTSPDHFDASGAYLGRWEEVTPACDWCAAPRDMNAQACEACWTCFECEDDARFCSCLPTPDAKALERWLSERP